MKKEYNFSKGERGKFYQTDSVLNVPVYLDPEIRAFVESIAKKRHSDLSSVVNKLIKTDKQLTDYLL